jgi:hypothetical protein
VLALRGGGDPTALHKRLSVQSKQRFAASEAGKKVSTAGLGTLQFGNIDFEGQQIGMVYEKNLDVSIHVLDRNNETMPCHGGDMEIMAERRGQHAARR